MNTFLATFVLRAIRPVAIALVALFTLPQLAVASPSAFAENAAWAGVTLPAGIVAGAEFLLPVDLVDAAAGFELVVGSGRAPSVRAHASALLFPALGTTPPLALGVGVDAGTKRGTFAAHVGAIVGVDLLFVSDIPGTVSLYLAPGFAAGFDVAYTLSARYYYEAWAIEVASSDIAPFSVRGRLLF